MPIRWGMWQTTYLNPAEGERLARIVEAASSPSPGDAGPSLPAPSDALRVAAFVRSTSGLRRVCRDVELAERGRR
jgi:triphosphoribosyl-dephospho-CoA synthetase